MENTTQQKKAKELLEESLKKEAYFSDLFEKAREKRKSFFFEMKRERKEDLESAGRYQDLVSLKLDIASDNVIFYQEKVAKETLANLLRKYAGKKAGTKTLEKFYDEFKEEAGFYGYFERSYSSIESFYFKFSHHSENVYITLKERSLKFIDGNNVFQKLEMPDFYENEKEESLDRDISKRARQVQKAQKALNEAKKEYNIAADNLNYLLPCTRERARKIY